MIPRLPRDPCFKYFLSLLGIVQGKEIHLLARGVLCAFLKFYSVILATHFIERTFRLEATPLLVHRHFSEKLDYGYQFHWSKMNNMKRTKNYQNQLETWDVSFWISFNIYRAVSLLEFEEELTPCFRHQFFLLWIPCLH